MELRGDALRVLEATSRTFFIPISRLPPGLLEAVTSAYLCMRAIDEIEDHPTLDHSRKAELLRAVSLALQSVTEDNPTGSCAVPMRAFQDTLPEVTLRLDDWLLLAPPAIGPRIADATAAMADRMAHWAANNWRIRTETELDQYTFVTAAAVGLLLSELWAWYDGTQTNRYHAIGFGRGLQAVNILRNQAEDLERGVDFFPDGWTPEQMQAYARRNLRLADAYVRELPPGPALDWCTIPLALAYATLNALAHGERKLTRSAVLEIVGPAAPRTAEHSLQHVD